MTTLRPHPSHFGKATKVSPGMFRASCKLKHPVLFDALTDADRDLVEELKLNAYRKTKRRAPDEIYVDVPCDFETVDRDEFVAHMKTVHNKGTLRTARPIRANWKPPRLTEDGVPWPVDDSRTDTCRSCGLVVEWGARPAEHARECERSTAVA